MILGVKNTDVEVHRYKDEPISGMSMNINVREVKVQDQNIEVAFTYTVFYNESIGMLRVDGTLYAKEEPKKANEIATGWKDQKLPPEFMEAVLNTINYSSGTEGTFFTRPLNLAPPIIPPRMETGNSKKKQK